MKHFTHPAFVFVSAAMAACCLAAGRVRTAAVRLVQAVKPAASIARTSAQADSAGRALDALRRRMQAAARRVLTATLLLLAVPGAGLCLAGESELWTDLSLLPAGTSRGGRALRLPVPLQDERPGATPPPGTPSPSRTRDGPARCVRRPVCPTITPPLRI